MRKRFFWSPSAANQRWPDAAGSGGPGGSWPFNWVKIDNRGGNDVYVGFEPTVVNDQMVYYAKVPSGKTRIFNVAGPHDDPEAGDAWPRELYLQNVTGATTVMIEIADHEISDIDQSI